MVREAFSRMNLQSLSGSTGLCQPALKGWGAGAANAVEMRTNATREPTKRLIVFSSKRSLAGLDAVEDVHGLVVRDAERRGAGVGDFIETNGDAVARRFVDPPAGFIAIQTESSSPFIDDRPLRNGDYFTL